MDFADKLDMMDDDCDIEGFPIDKRNTMKYYWICYEHTTRFGIVKHDDVFNKHPFKAIEKLRNESNGCYVILNYKEITEEEYEMFNKEYRDM